MHLVLALSAAISIAAPLSAQQTTFTCAPGKPSAATRTLTPATRFSTAAAGWDLAASPTLSAGSCASEAPFFFSTPEPDGNYRITVALGGPAASTTTIKAESRRLMASAVSVPANGSQTISFVVNVRSAPIAGTTDRVKLKPREIGALDWDEKLTLEFNGTHPSVRSITIAPIHVPTIYLAGDSTVVDQDKEPWAAWGQMLPVFLNDQVSVANEAESGETIKSFLGERRLAKIISTIQPGDFLMLQFAHNDQKPGGGFVPIDEYKSLVRSYVAQARAKGAATILVTSMNRRSFDPEGHIRATLGDYPQALRDVAAEDHLPLIDLNAMSKTLFEALGEQGTLKAFVHYPANTFPGQTDELKDDTHFTAYGAYELARCIVQAARDQNLPIARFLKPAARFDPSAPDTPESVAVPASPFLSTQTPYGR